MTFYTFLNTETLNLLDCLDTVNQDATAATVYIKDDDEQHTFMFYWNTSGTMIIFTMPEFQKAGMLSNEAGETKVGKGVLLSDVSDETLIQIFSKIRDVLSNFPGKSEQQDVAPDMAKSSDAELFETFIKYLCEEDYKPVVFRDEGEPKNRLLMEMGTSLVRINRYTYGEVTCVDVRGFTGTKDLANFAYYDKSAVITKTLTGEKIDDAMVETFFKILEGE